MQYINGCFIELCAVTIGCVLSEYCPPREENRRRRPAVKYYVLLISVAVHRMWECRRLGEAQVARSNQSLRLRHSLSGQTRPGIDRLHTEVSGFYSPTRLRLSLPSVRLSGHDAISVTLQRRRVPAGSLVPFGERHFLCLRIRGYQVPAERRARSGVCNVRSLA